MKESTIYYNNELKAVVWEIKGFPTLDEIKETGLGTNDLRKKYFAKKQLNNIQNMKVLTQDIQLWIENVWFPLAKTSGLEYFAFVVPNDTFGKASMDYVNENAKKKYGINIEYFTSEESAKQWLISQ